jgi:hypothetical protein
MPASGHQDHTTSPSALALFVKGASRVHRIPLHVRDDRERPSHGAGRGELVEMICPTSKVEYFFERGWTAIGDLPVGHDTGAAADRCEDGGLRCRQSALQTDGLYLRAAASSGAVSLVPFTTSARSTCIFTLRSSSSGIIIALMTTFSERRLRAREKISRSRTSDRSTCHDCILGFDFCSNIRRGLALRGMRNS